MKKDNINRNAKAGKFEPPPDGIFHGRPNLADACCNPFWDDRSPKGCWALSLNWDTGMCTVSVSDKEEGRSLNSTASTAEEALDLMEALLATEHRPWRYWGGKRRK